MRHSFHPTPEVVQLQSRRAALQRIANLADGI
jgi:hypothetical protein